MAVIDKSFIIKKSSVAVALSAIALYGSQFNYLVMSLLFPGDEERYVITGASPEFFVGIIFIGGTFLLAILKTDKLERNKPSTPFIMLVIASVAIFLSIIYNEVGWRPIITLLSFVLYFWAARTLASRYTDILACRLNKWLIIIPPLFLCAISYFFFTDRMVFSGEFRTEFLKPQIKGGIRSTELSNLAVLQIIYMIYALRSLEPLKIKLHIIFMLFILVVFLFVFFSVAAIFFLFTILVLWHYFLNKNINKIKIFGISLLILVILGFGIPVFIDIDFFSYVIEYKLYDLTNEGTRGFKYLLLMEHIRENPLFGIGWGNFVKSNIGWFGKGTYPHNYILGIAAENGIIASIFYIGFVISTLYVGIRTALWYKRCQLSSTNKIIWYFIFMSIASFSFMSLRGLIHENWQLKEIYFWAGMIVGTAEWIRANKSKG